MPRRTRKKDILIHECTCTVCGGKMYVPRDRSRLRERGHKKRLFCPYCGKRINMEENDL